MLFVFSKSFFLSTYFLYPHKNIHFRCAMLYLVRNSYVMCGLEDRRTCMLAVCLLVCSMCMYSTYMVLWYMYSGTCTGTRTACTRTVHWYMHHVIFIRTFIRNRHCLCIGNLPYWHHTSLVHSLLVPRPSPTTPPPPPSRSRQKHAGCASLRKTFCRIRT